ncbi:MAG: ABC transporter permease [Nitrospirota bacterium]
MGLFADTLHLFNKYMRITIRMPMWTLFGLIQPLIWLVIFSQLFQNMAKIQGFPNNSYIDFFVPGVLVMTVVFGSSWSGVSLLREITFGTVEKMMVTPVSRSSIVLSRVLHSSSTVILQCIIILIIALIIGASINYEILSIVLSMVIILLLSIGFSSLSNGFAILLQREEPLVVIGNFMTLPLMFFSSALIPQNFMPQWMRVLSIINPIEYAVKGIRTVLVGENDLNIFLNGLIFLFIFCIASFGWATYMFVKNRE